MAVTVPDFIYERPPGSLTATLIEPDVVLFLRETEFGLRKYPVACPIELRIGTWEIEQVILVTLLLRLSRSDATTYEAWINVGDPLGVRMLQKLKPQPKVGVHFVTDKLARTLRVANPMRVSASGLVHVLRKHHAWTPDQFTAAQRRLSTLYPTAADLWWRCDDQTQV
jgi:hypothetical protein